MTTGHSKGRTRRLLSVLPLNRGSIRALVWLANSGVPENLKDSSYLPSVSWSQDGEDVLLVEKLPQVGRYVDVGAHDPYRYSNTKLLYDKGWRGLNIDVTHGFSERFTQHRPEDVNVRALVGTAGTRTLYRFDDEALNTLSKERAETLQADGWALQSMEQVPVKPLDEILTESGIPRHIHLLSVDAEGSDLEVLESLDWVRWEVERVLVEVGAPAYRVDEDPIAVFLKGKGFLLSHAWWRSCLFERNPEWTPEA